MQIEWTKHTAKLCGRILLSKNVYLDCSQLINRKSVCDSNIVMEMQYLKIEYRNLIVRISRLTYIIFRADNDENIKNIPLFNNWKEIHYSITYPFVTIILHHCKLYYCLASCVKRTVKNIFWLQKIFAFAGCPRTIYLLQKNTNMTLQYESGT